MKISGVTVGTPLKPEKSIVKATELTEEQKAQARENIGAVDAEYVRTATQTYIDEAILGGAW